MSRIIETDDDSRNHSYLWFGPTEMPLPVGARLPAVGWAIVLIPVVTVLVWVLTPFVDLLPGPSPLVFLGHAVLSALGGFAGSVLLIRTAGKHVSKQTPLRYHVANWQGEVATPRPARPAGERSIAVPDLWAPTDASTRTISTTIRFEE